MNTLDKNEKTRQQIVRLSMLEAPGTLLLALGIYGYFSDGETFMPILSLPEVHSAMIMIGLTIMAWCSYQMIRVLAGKPAGEGKEI